MISDKQLDTALRAFHHDPSSHRDLETVVGRVLATPIEEAPQRRGILDRIEGWGSRAAFGGVRFVVAGVIVALFGGLVLSGLLTQPSDESMPEVGASASGSPEADAVPAPVRTDILPGVALAVEEVEPGFYRVLGDGIRNISGRVRSMAMGPDGDVWLALDTTRYWNVIRLGEEGRMRAPRRKERTSDRDFGTLGVTPDGMPVIVRGSATWQLDGDAWARTELSAYDRCALEASLAGPGIADWAVDADGGCWTHYLELVRTGQVAPLMDEAMLVRIDPDGTQTAVTRADLGLEPDQDIGRFATGPDGTVWSTMRSLGRFEGLLAYDGSSWTAIPYDGEGSQVYDAIAVDAEGAVWISWLSPLLDGERNRSTSRILRWDDESWTEHPFMVSQGGREPIRIRPWPNGVIWFHGVATRWDGHDLVEFEPSDRWRDLEGRADTAPDGSAWLASGDQLYVITADAVAGTG